MGDLEKVASTSRNIIKLKSRVSENVLTEEDVVRHFNKDFPREKIGMPPRWLPRTADAITQSQNDETVRRKDLREFGEKYMKKREEKFNAWRQKIQRKAESDAMELKSEIIKKGHRHRRQAGRKASKRQNWKDRRERNRKNKGAGLQADEGPSGK